MTYFNSEIWQPMGTVSGDLRCTRTPHGEPRVTIIKSLKSDEPLCKRFFLGSEGNLASEPYGKPYKFKAKNFPMPGIHELYNLVRKLHDKRNHALIRGLHHLVSVPNTVRQKAVFPEHPEGTPWVMIDFDDIPLPQGIDPLSLEAMEYGISLLPGEFHSVTYCYQYSSSAGICLPDGSPLKTGLNAHVFFWLSRRVIGPLLDAWLKDDAIERGTYRIEPNKGGVPMVQWAFDPAVLKNPIQPHYLASPEIGDGVTSLLENDSRHGLCEKGDTSVSVPDLSMVDPTRTKHQERRLCNDYKVRMGWKAKQCSAVSRHGTTIRQWQMHPPDNVGATGRNCVGYHFADDNKRDRIILEFEDENTPGSWWVGDMTPMTARRFGDEAEVPLWELSPNAFDLVAHEVGWFNPVVRYRESLDNYGRLPPIDSFVDTRAALVLAPTGSGKTYQIAQWIKLQSDLVIYTAETIALNRQTFDDLQEEGVNVGFYQDIRRPSDLSSVDCIVTTLKSLPRILNLAQSADGGFKLVVDEIHRAVDWMLQTNDNLRKMEGAFRQSIQAIMLTGTLSDFQSKVLSDSLFQVLGSLDPDQYAIFQFDAVNAYPLELRNEGDFDYFLYQELSRVADAYGAGTDPPKVAAIVPTSRMERFRVMVAALELADETEIVSRAESLDEEVYDARLSQKPVLIASPIFALGINFVQEPDVFLFAAGQLQWDQNSIVQAVNRANRSDKRCRTLLFVGHTDKDPVRLPKKLAEERALAWDLEHEATLDGALERHLHLDRVTAKCIADREKDTAKALHTLIENDSIQNYRIYDRREETIKLRKDTEQILRDFRADGRAYYDSLIESFRLQPQDEMDRSNIPFIIRIDSVKAVRDDWGNDAEDRETRRELESRELAAIADLCDLNTRSHMEQVSKVKLRRLLGEALPYMTQQHHNQPTHFRVAAEKLSLLIPVLEALKQVQAGMDTYWFAGQIRRKGQLREGLRALADNETEFHAIMEQHKQLRDLKQAYQRSSSEENREAIENYCLALAEQFFQSIGIQWTKKKNDDGRWVRDFSSPCLSRHVDLEKAIFNVMQLQAACRRWEDSRERLYLGGADGLPESVLEDIVDSDFAHTGWPTGNNSPMPGLQAHGYRDPETCQNCVFFKDMGCLKGLPVDWLRDLPAEGRIYQCGKRRRAPTQLRSHAEWTMGKFVEKLPRHSESKSGNDRGFRGTEKTSSSI